MKFIGDPGPTDDFTGLSAVQVFKLFFCSAVWNLLVDETNRYALQTISDHDHGQYTWTPTDVHEMRPFVELLIAMGINNSPQYSMYWSTSEVLRMPLYPFIMPRNRFSDIMRFFHLSNNQIPEPASVKCDKLNKLRPLLDFILPKFGSLYYPGQNLSPDESMLKFKGRLCFLQYMPRKPVKLGMKAFSLNESETGYSSIPGHS